MKNFDEPDRKRVFEIKGRTFHYRDLRPQDMLLMMDDANPWQVLDLKIMQFLPIAEHAAWLELRADEDDPITVTQMNEIYMWLCEQQGFEMREDQGSRRRARRKTQPAPRLMSMPGKRRK